MILHKLGRMFLSLLQQLCSLLRDCWGRVCSYSQQSAGKGSGKGAGIVVETPGRGREAYDVPVSLAVGVTFAWIFACAGLFHYLEENWDYFTSFYFVFISLTTIGYGSAPGLEILS